MSRRCRASLIQGAGGAAGDLSSGCSCGRLAGPGPPPCTEPIIYGSNLLKDPGFETQLAEYGGGPFGDEIPGVFGVTGAEYSDESVVSSNGIPWIAAERRSPSASPDYWTIETTAPDTGAFHARFYPQPTTNHGGGRIFPTAQYPCELELFGPFPWYTAIAEPGDLYVLSARAKIDVAVPNDSGGFGPELFLHGFGFNLEGFEYQSDGTPGLPLTTSYQTFVLSGFVMDVQLLFGDPPIKYLNYWIETDGGSNAGDDLRVDVDSVQLTLVQGGKSILLCAQSGLITIDNSTTETAFL